MRGATLTALDSTQARHERPVDVQLDLDPIAAAQILILIVCGACGRPVGLKVLVCSGVKQAFHCESVTG